MIFSSLLFLFWFIPVFFTVYYICPGRFRNAVLFIGSIIFYAWGEPEFLVLIFISIFVNYIMGLLMYRAKADAIRRLCLIIALTYDFLMLFIFKYADFFIENINRLTGAGLHKVNITLPLGISFYTFQERDFIISVISSFYVQI